MWRHVGQQVSARSIDPLAKDDETATRTALKTAGILNMAMK